MSPQKVTEDVIYTHWLLKAEPETRIEKGVDVKFSIDDFEECKVTSWEGVRNHEAKKIMKERMQLGQLCLFYASNCKIPGITGLAQVVRTGYPDHNAWDPKHPYYDPKTDSDNPTWYMVDLEFISRLPHLVSLKLLQSLAQLTAVPDCIASYLTPAHLDAIANSALIKRGRLSVQPASEEFYEAVKLLGEKGGWEELVEVKGKGGKGKGKGKKEAVAENEEPPSKKRAAVGAVKGKGKRKGKGKSAKMEESADDGSEEEIMPQGSSSRPSKRKKA